MQCTGEFPELGKPEESGETRQEPVPPGTAADETCVGPAATVTKPTHKYKRSPKGMLVTRAGKQAAARQFAQQLAHRKGAGTLPARPGSSGIHPAEGHGLSKLCTHPS